jgi:hypothetical protein
MVRGAAENPLRKTDGIAVFGAVLRKSDQWTGK